MSQPSVAHTTEFQRIISLPRRVWSAEALSELAEELTDILRTPAGTMKLRPVQALALFYAGTERGLFGCPIGVGEGKTLISLLLPVLLGARRPLLLMPGGLIEDKTQRERLELAKHWRLPTTLRAFGYEMLGRVQSASVLEDYRPDAIICDEVSALKNKRAAVTRRVARYMHAYPETVFCGLDGSPMDKSFKEFAHILLWCLKTKAPIPFSNEEQDEWAETLDERVDPGCRRQAGALLELCSESELKNDEHVSARLGFRRRLTETPGVVATIGEGEHVGARIHVQSIRHEVSAETEKHFTVLRSKWCTPGGEQCMLGTEVWRHAQEMALGLYYRWEPQPPEEWLQPRKRWHAFVRETISRSRSFDSELHVAQACDAEHEPKHDLWNLGRQALASWRQVRNSFRPNVVPVWFDDHALQAAAAWMRAAPGLVWTEHHFFAMRLAKLTGAAYYGAGGLDSSGRYIEDAKPGESAIASIDANRKGKNLQRLWSRNMLVCPPKSASWMEQTIARTHRPGQEAEDVYVYVLLGCRENFDACVSALADAAAIEQTTGKRQKLMMADVQFPSESEVDSWNSMRWQRR